jgi:putative DNA primase/helicase
VSVRTRPDDTLNGVPSLNAMARALGGEVRGREIVCPGPGHSPRDLSLAVRPEPAAAAGLLVHSFAGDDPIRCLDYIRERLDIDPWRSVRTAIGSVSTRLRVASGDADGAQQARIAAALRIWSECAEPRGTPVEGYLASRCLHLDTDVTAAIRHHPGLSYDGTRLPAMVALLRDIKTNRPCGIHRTWLDPDSRMVARRMLGRARGAAVKLDRDAAIAHALTIGEGIETSLAARQLECGPVWAVGSAVAIQAFPVLPGIEVLNVLGECDDNGANNEGDRSDGRALARCRPSYSSTCLRPAT